MSTPGSASIEIAPPLPPLVLAACIAAMVLGVLGLGVGLVQVVGGLLGGFGASMIAFSGDLSFVTIWPLITTIVGLLISGLGAILSLVAAITGLMGILKKKVGLLKWSAIALVLFDVFCHLIWPLIGAAGGIYAQMEMPPDLFMTMAIGIVIGALITFVWSLVLTVLWAAIAVIAMRYKPETTLV
ncbi:MAG: hypothetical protein AB8H79_07975 [Myxococcota bacterium]